ncbi:hypothetical protein [Pectobacterium parmentieri]|uniref:hypothetical protein n=2 Tax=Pectobacterium parmentieri TaxID=1905730 RepID=UPI000CDDB120|nr:hypothetical protein [Pectobacterium parmentieri]AYH04256.1 hypothetical protein C5E25_01950 [Pectobacterium parmentieri]AYH04262.1 hypothetical protein C5E25_01990 [Pectobacterium parmentieri]AYH13077.1 hypothetical protein C5E23_01935 [Pectobacterium parmentieri]AYH13083.1 hypothetical protein C5E23_01975 [Pectobacterium parmentieri]AYH21779.1 hypothetical protein C5E21_01930 [Pectobacterium parmentieri]
MNEINNICNDLGLPIGDDFTQDWAYELSDEYRTEEWLDKYITAYLNNGYSVNSKNELMTLCLDVTNDLLSAGISVINATIIKVLSALIDNYQQHVDLINYWSLDDEPLEDCFALTPEIRKLKKY